MAILSRDEYFNRLHDVIGEDSSDASISFLEDMTDTFNDFEKKANGDGVDWQSKYHELDENWKKKYRHRFFSGDNNYTPEDKTSPEQDEYQPDEVMVEDLFKEVK